MQKSIFTRCTLLLMFIFSFLFLSVTDTFSHSTYPESLEKTVGNAVVDIGYDPASFEAEAPHTFDFELYNQNKSEQLPYTTIWVLITRGNDTVFATGIKKQELTATTLIYTFPKEGEYTFAVRYQNNDTTVAETSFPITVIAEQKIVPSFVVYSGIGFAGLLIGGIIGIGIVTFRKKR